MKNKMIDISPRVVIKEVQVDMEASELSRITYAGGIASFDGPTLKDISSGFLTKCAKYLDMSKATSNPSIILNLVKSPEGKERVIKMIEQGKKDTEIVQALILEYFRLSVDALKAGGQKTPHFSIEINPDYADSLDDSMQEARSWRTLVNEQLGASYAKALMIKVPAVGAWKEIGYQLALENFSPNYTLLFSRKQIQEVHANILRAYDALLADKKPMEDILPIISIFKSRKDNEAHKLITDMSLQGYAGVSHGVVLYNEEFVPKFLEASFDKYTNAGARHPIWFPASTGSKGPSYGEQYKQYYPADIYVAPFLGAFSGNTLPGSAIEELLLKGVNFQEPMNKTYYFHKQKLMALGEAGVNIEQISENQARLGAESFDKDGKAIFTKVAEYRKEVEAKQ